MVKRSQMTRLRDRRGRTPDLGELGREVAFPQEVGPRRVIADAVASGLSPERLAGILRESANGRTRAYLTLAEEMEERYLHYASQLQTRRLAIEGIPVSIEHDNKVPPKIVDAVNELVDGAAYDEMTGALPDAIGKGFSAVEMMWEFQDGALKPVEYKWRDPRFFQFDEMTQTELRLADMADVRNGLQLPSTKFIVHMPRSKMGIPIRRGMARPAAWAFLIQSFSLKDWAAFAEIYGVPLRVGKYHSAASEPDKRTLLQAVRMIASDAAAIIPAGMELEFHKVEGQHGAAVFGGLIDYVDKQISKLVVGQTMTSDDGGSLAQAKVHNDVRMDILKADGKQLGQTITRDLIVPFVDLNFGPQEVYPRAEYAVAEPEDIGALTKAVQILVPLGLRVSQREMRERVGLSEPEKDEELLAAPAREPSQPPPDDGKNKPSAEKAAELSAHVEGCRCNACLAGTKTPTSLAAEPRSGVDEVEALADAALSDWQDVTDPILTPLRHILERASSFEEALKMLEAGGPDSAKLVEALATSTAIARGIGAVRD